MTDKKSFSLLGALSIVISAVLWGFDGVVLTPRLYNLDVSYVVFMLHALPFAVLNLFFFKEYKKIRTFTKQDFITFSLIGFFGGSIGTLAIVKALFLMNFHHLTIVVLLQKLQPVFSITLASILLKEKLHKNFIAWASLAIVMSYFLTFGFSLPDFHAEGNVVLASLLAILAAFSFGSSTVFSKKVLHKFDFKSATFFRYGFTTAIMLFYVLSTGAISQLTVTTPQNWLFFTIIALTTGSGAIFLYYFGLKRVKGGFMKLFDFQFY
jgi:drug/metabolite transporter (DMT)-like permease